MFEQDALRGDLEQKSGRGWTASAVGAEKVFNALQQFCFARRQEHFHSVMYVWLIGYAIQANYSVTMIQVSACTNACASTCVNGSRNDRWTTNFKLT